MKFYSDLTTKQKKELRLKFKDLNELRDEQIKIFENAFIKPLKDLNELENKVKKNERSINQYLEQSKKFSDWISEFFKTKKIYYQNKTILNSSKISDKRQINIEGITLLWSKKSNCVACGRETIFTRENMHMQPVYLCQVHGEMEEANLEERGIELKEN